MTNRPDKLDTDLKRPGRLDVKIPLFYPQSGLERAAVVLSVLRRYAPAAAQADSGQAWLDDVFETSEEYSNAELELLTLLALEFARRRSAPISREDFESAIKDFLRTGDQRMGDYMSLLAVSESSRRSLLPEKYQDLTSAQLSEQLRLLRSDLRL